MSRETLTHLNQNVLVGYTSKRGKAWHYKASEQGAESNHYEYAIPVEDVRRRLFNWTPVEGPVETTLITADGVTRIVDPERKTIVRPDTQTILGVFKSGYQVHGYDEWLVTNVERILDADLAIGSAGLLKGGAVAWVQVEVENTMTVNGVDYRPFLTAVTSLDGTIATTYITGSQVVICDNTLSVARTTADEQFRVKHTAHSLNRLQDARDALKIVHSVGDDFAAQVEALTAQVVTDAQFGRWLQEFAPVDPKASMRSQNIASTKQRELRSLWTSDERVAPWAGTAYGVLAAANTHLHHLGTVRNVSRADRNAERVVRGQVAAADRAALEALATVLA